MMMMIPVEWLFSILGLMFAGIMAWIWHGFANNRADHKELFHVTTKTEAKIDHIIHHHEKMPPFDG